MANRQFTNDASSILAGTISSSSTTVQLSTGDGSFFPALSGTEFFVAAIQDTAGNIEYVKVTAISGDNLTVVRGYENSTALGFTANLARVELRDTAGTLASFYQKDGDTLSGPLNGGGQTATNLVLGSGVSIESATEIVNTPLRGATGVTTNQIVVPADGSPATMGGLPISTATGSQFSIGMIMMWNGSIPDIPAGWHVCDGTDGTPDLRDKFVLGAGATYNLGNTGNASYSTSSVSAGAPTIAPFTLTAANLPPHAHPFDYYFANSAAVIANPGSSSPGYYMFGGSGAGVKTAYAGSPGPGTSAPVTPSGAALAGHAHTVTGSPYYALFFIQRIS